MSESSSVLHLACNVLITFVVFNEGGNVGVVLITKYLGLLPLILTILVNCLI